MIIDQTIVTNLLSHKYTLIQWSGDRINVSGDNGAGKTSATIDAPLWALFGNARGSTTDDLKGPWGNAMEVEVDFRLNGKQYKVTRKRGSSSGLFLHNVTDGVDLSEKHISMTQEKITGLVGTENSFTNTVIFKQGDALRFAQMKPAERGALIDELTGIEDMSQISKSSAQRSKAAEHERERLQSELDRLNVAAGEVQNLEQSIRLLEKEIEELDDQLRTAKRDSDDAEQMLKDVQDGHTQKTLLEGQFRQLSLKYSQADSAYVQIVSAKKTLQDQIESLSQGENCPTCDSKLDPSHPSVIRKIDAMTNTQQELNTKAQEQAEACKNLRNEVSAAEAMLAKVDVQISDKYSRARSLKESSSLQFQKLSNSRSEKQSLLSSKQGQAAVLNRDLPKLQTIASDIERAKKRIKGFDLITEAFSKRGIPRELKRSFVAEIEKGANSLLIGLSSFTVRLSLEKDGVSKGGVTEGTMDIWARDGLSERKVELLSGGEKMRVMLAVRLATAQAMAKKNERSIKTLIIDEGLDGLDISGKDAALTMIQSLTNFERILMITHDPSVAGYFPHRIHFTKMPDGSSSLI